MTLRPDTDEATLALVRRADPLPTNRGDEVDDEAALRAVAERIDALEAPQNRDPREPRRACRVRPRVLAGSTLGVMGVAGALALVLGTSATPPAYAISKHSDGSVLVQLNSREDLGQANQKLTDLGIHEQITLYRIPGPAAVSGPVNCRPGPGAGPPNPPVRVLVNTDRSHSGQGSGNSGEGSTSHTVCIVGPSTYSGPFPGNANPTGRAGRS